MSDHNPYTAPHVQKPVHSPETKGDATGGLIPYKNAPALIGYYTGIASLLPCIGLPLGFIAIVLGIMGMVKRSKNPIVKGMAHAIIALVLGAVSTLYNSVIVAALIIGYLGSN